MQFKKTSIILAGILLLAVGSIAAKKKDMKQVEERDFEKYRKVYAQAYKLSPRKSLS